jgi:chromosome segregation ATPase
MAQIWNSQANDNFIDLDQLVKRLEWLDSERRKDKNRISAIEERFQEVLSENIQLKAQIKDLETEIAQYTNVHSKIELVDGRVSQLKVDAFRAIDEKDKNHAEREKEIDSARRNGIDAINRTLAEMRKSIEPLQDIRKTLIARNEDAFRLSRMIEEVGARVDVVAMDKDEYARFQKTVEENRRLDAKKVMDIQTELSAYRKRIEDMRGRVDLVNDSIQKLDQRMNELMSAENERKQSVTAFQEKQSLINLEYEKTWQDWKAAFDDIIVKAAGLDTQLSNLENTHRSVKRSQDTLDEVTHRFDRRTNELIEMQRLMEEKLRQEWATFKTDNQKRWSNYSLGQDEIHAEYQRGIDALKSRMQTIEDTSASAIDEVSVRDEMRITQMQELYTLVRSWLEKMGNTGTK